MTSGGAYMLGFYDGASESNEMDSHRVEEPLRPHYVHGFLRGFGALRKAAEYAREMDQGAEAGRG